AATAIGGLELDVPAVRPHLAKALRDDKLEVRRAALRGIQRLGPEGVLLLPDLIQLAEKKEYFRAVERLMRRFERNGPDARSVPELIALLEHKQENVRLLSIKFLGLAGPPGREAIPALERLNKDPSTDVQQQAKAVSEQLKKLPASKTSPSGAPQ